MMLGVAAFIFILWVFALLAAPFRTPASPAEIEVRKTEARRIERIAAREERDEHIERMNKAISKDKIDEALIWNKKAIEAEERLQRNK